MHHLAGGYPSSRVHPSPGASVWPMTTGNPWTIARIGVALVDKPSDDAKHEGGGRQNMTAERRDAAETRTPSPSRGSSSFSWRNM